MFSRATWQTCTGFRTCQAMLCATPFQADCRGSKVPRPPSDEDDDVVMAEADGPESLRMRANAASSISWM